ncbi:MAG: metallophosphoesterase family protein [Candidatus Aminicenantaceae bacterium]
MHLPSIPNTARARCRGVLFFIVFCLAASTGCSHVKPFYREAPAPLNQPAPSPDAIRYRLLLIGDAGAPREDEPTLALLAQWARVVPNRTMVIFLGDNVYSDGMPPPDTPERTERERHVVVVGHHPLDTHGIHGGFYDWKDHLFPLRVVKSWMWLPLPIIGSLYPLLRWNVRKHYEELNSDTYRDMIRRFGEVFSIKKPLLNAGGHDHSLQVMVGDSVGYILVSGAGIDSRLSTVTDRENTLFAHLHTGFMAVDFLEDGSVWLSVAEPGPTEVVFHLRLDLRRP